MTSCNDTIRIPSSQVLGATSSQIIHCPPPEWLTLLIIGGTILGLTVALYWYISIGFSEYARSQPYRYYLTQFILSIYCCYSLLNFLKLLNTSGAEVYEYLADCIEALCMVAFLSLYWEYAGGYEKVLPKLEGSHCSLATAPCCCLKFCTPLFKLNRRFINYFSYLLLQLPVVQFIVGLINISIALSYDSESGQTVTTLGSYKSIASALLGAVLGLSGFLALYAISTLHIILGQFTLGKAMNWKFLLFKTPIILSKVQAVIFTLVEGSVYSYGYVTAEYRVTQWNSFALITEFFILLLLASLIYRRCDFDTSPVARSEIDTAYGDENMVNVDLGEPELILRNRTAV